MFQTGEFVVKAGKGVCRVSEIGGLNITGMDKNRKYYTLIPMNDPDGRIYVPVDKAETSLRKTMTEEEAREFLAKVPAINELKIENEKLRETRYKEALKSYNPETIAELVKTTYTRKKKRDLEGKKCTAADERYFKQAEALLCMELAYVFKIDMKQASEMMRNSVK